MGPMKRDERIMLFLFALVAGLWMTTALHGINYIVIAFVGVSLLLLSRVLEWDDVLEDRQAWDTFIWYGGLIHMAAMLGASGITTHVRGVLGRHDRGLELGRGGRRPAAGVLLFALRVRQHHGPRHARCSSRS